MLTLNTELLRSIVFSFSDRKTQSQSLPLSSFLSFLLGWGVPVNSRTSKTSRSSIGSISLAKSSSLRQPSVRTPESPCRARDRRAEWPWSASCRSPRFILADYLLRQQCGDLFIRFHLPFAAASLSWGSILFRILWSEAKNVDMFRTFIPQANKLGFWGVRQFILILWVWSTNVDMVCLSPVGNGV